MCLRLSKIICLLEYIYIKNSSPLLLGILQGKTDFVQGFTLLITSNCLSIDKCYFYKKLL